MRGFFPFAFAQGQNDDLSLSHGEPLGDKRTFVRVSVCEGWGCALHFFSGSSANTPMKIHEYQAKEILRKYGVPVPAGEMATTLEEADTISKNLFGAGNK